MTTRVRLEKRDCFSIVYLKNKKNKCCTSKNINRLCDVIMNTEMSCFDLDISTDFDVTVTDNTIEVITSCNSQNLEYIIPDRLFDSGFAVDTIEIKAVNQTTSLENSILGLSEGFFRENKSYACLMLRKLKEFDANGPIEIKTTGLDPTLLQAFMENSSVPFLSLWCLETKDVCTFMTTMPTKRATAASDVYHVVRENDRSIPLGFFVLFAPEGEEPYHPMDGKYIDNRGLFTKSYRKKFKDAIDCNTLFDITNK